jgi:hypothetical protein
MEESRQGVPSPVTSEAAGLCPNTIDDSNILELKLTNRYPNCLRDLVRAFNLMQLSSAKYSQGVVVLGEHCFYNGERPITLHEPSFPPAPGPLMALASARVDE